MSLAVSVGQLMHHDSGAKVALIHALGIHTVKGMLCHVLYE